MECAAQLYQFHPTASKADVVAKVLLLALTQLPSTDYLAASYLVPERLHADPSIAAVGEMAGLLESCDFAAFWAKADKKLAGSVKGFDEAIRAFIAGVLSTTYTTVPKALVLEALAIDDGKLKAVAEANGWKVDGDVVCPSSTDASGPSAPINTQVQLDQMAKLLQVSK